MEALTAILARSCTPNRHRLHYEKRLFSAITNNSYFGEIANQGDVVRIQKEPDVTVNALQRHTAISVEKLDDTDFQLTIDKANYFAFKMDDIEEQFSHVDFVF